MALTPSWPGVTGLATTTDARKAIAGLIARNTSGVARSGILPAHANALVTARADMNVDIAAFAAVGVQFGGPVLFTNDGVAQLPSALVSPGSGTNYYVVYAKQNESTAPGTDANNNRVFGAQLSTTSFAVARSALPVGAVELGTVEMPTGKTATNQGGVIITATYQLTALTGAVVGVRSSTELTAWTPADGSLAYRLDDTITYKRVGGAWKPWDSDWIIYTPTGQSITHTTGGSSVYKYRFAGGDLEIEIAILFGTATTIGGGAGITFNIPSGYSIASGYAAYEHFGTGGANADGGVSTFSPLTIARIGASASQLMFLAPLASGSYVTEGNVTLSTPFTFQPNGTVSGRAALRVV